MSSPGSSFGRRSRHRRHSRTGVASNRRRSYASALRLTHKRSSPLAPASGVSTALQSCATGNADAHEVVLRPCRWRGRRAACCMPGESIMPRLLAWSQRAQARLWQTTSASPRPFAHTHWRGPRANSPARADPNQAAADSEPARRVVAIARPATTASDRGVGDCRTHAARGADDPSTWFRRAAGRSGSRRGCSRTRCRRRSSGVPAGRRPACAGRACTGCSR
jgi:hypothetical protein